MQTSEPPEEEGWKLPTHPKCLPWASHCRAACRGSPRRVLGRSRPVGCSLAVL